MKKWLCIFFVPLFLCSASTIAVTYGKAGRFGDSVLCYLRAKWLSYQHGIKLVYLPFHFSDQLILDNCETHYKKDRKKYSRKKIRLEKHPFDFSREEPTLYVCPYFPEDPWELRQNNWYFFQVDWQDLAFRKLALEMIAPKKSLSLITPPPHTLNVAVHVREGGSYDFDETKRALPLKFPPLSFYVEGLKEVLSHCPGQPIYCHIFTDSHNPKQIVDLFKEAIEPDDLIQFGYREENSCKTNILEDFYSLFNFDMLIRPQSNFSLVPSLLHDFAIVYHPVNATQEDNGTQISEVNLLINDVALHNAFKRLKPTL